MDKIDWKRDEITQRGSIPPDSVGAIREQSARIRKMTVPHLLDHAQKRQWGIQIIPNGSKMSVRITDKSGKTIGKGDSINDNERTFAMAMVSAATAPSDYED